MHLRRTHLVLALVAALAMPAMASADATFTFTGHGYGHGVGMGQYGAQGYALQGWTHEQILAHYYQGTTLGPTTFTQVRVLLQDGIAQVAASAPAGITAADEGGTATLAIPGAGAVAVRKDADGFTLLDAAGAVLAHGWVGPVSLAATDGGPVTLAGAALNGLADGRYRGRLRVLASTPPPAACRQSTSSRSRATCSASSPARCRRPGSRRRSRPRRSLRAPTPWRPARPPRAPTTSSPTSAARSTAGSRPRRRPRPPPWPPPRARWCSIRGSRS